MKSSLLNQKMYQQTIMAVMMLTMMMMSCDAKIYDLSHNHGPRTLMSTKEMPGYNYTTLFKGTHYTGAYWDFGYYASSEHGGTHIDAPNHKVKGGKPLEAISIEDTIADGVMIDCSKEAKKQNDYGMTVQKILDWEKENGEIPRDSAVLVNFGWSSKFDNEALYRGTSNFSNTLTHVIPYISEEAGKWLFNNRRPHILGTDTLTPDPLQINGKHTTFPIHELYLSNNIIIVENLRDLGQLPARGFRFHSPPVKYVGATGAQVRAFAITHDHTENGAAIVRSSLCLMGPVIFLFHLKWIL